MPSRDSKIVTARLHINDVEKLKRSNITASQIIREYLNKGNTPVVEEEVCPVDLSDFLRMCERRKKSPQSVIDMITEQLASM